MLRIKQLPSPQTMCGACAFLHANYELSRNLTTSASSYLPMDADVVLQQSIDISCPPGPQLVCCRGPMMGQTGGQTDSLATLIYAVVNSRMDYCNTVLAGAPRTVTDKLQRVLNAAACVITGIRKFDRGLGQILHDQLHWLDVPDRVLLKLAVTVHQCLNGRTPLYLSEYCIPVSSALLRAESFHRCCFVNYAAVSIIAVRTNYLLHLLHQQSHLVPPLPLRHRLPLLLPPSRPLFSPTPGTGTTLQAHSTVIWHRCGPLLHVTYSNVPCS